MNGIDDEQILAYRRLRCVVCAARQREIDAEFKKAHLAENIRDDLQRERATLTPRYSAIDERVLALVEKRYPAVHADFPFVLYHKSAFTKSLQLLIVNTSEAMTSHGLERVLDTMRNINHTKDMIKYIGACANTYNNAAQLHRKRCKALQRKQQQLTGGGQQTLLVVPASMPAPVLSDPPLRPCGKVSDNSISTCIAQYAAEKQVIANY